MIKIGTRSRDCQTITPFTRLFTKLSDNYTCNTVLKPVWTPWNTQEKNRTNENKSHIEIYIFRSRDCHVLLRRVREVYEMLEKNLKKSEYSTPRETRREHGRGHPRQSRERRTGEARRATSTRNGGPHFELSYGVYDWKPGLNLTSRLLGQHGQQIYTYIYTYQNLFGRCRYSYQNVENKNRTLLRVHITKVTFLSSR